MARLVVLQFDDNELAEAFTQHNSMVAAGQAEVVGLFAMPTLFCPSSGTGGCSKSKRVRAWAQGKKYGWWVCVVCGRPSGYRPETGNPEHWRPVLSQGVNLLRDADDQDMESIFDEGSGVYNRGGR